MSTHPLQPRPIETLLDQVGRFCRLCQTLYEDLNEPTGGPLHAQLDDHNLDFLHGDQGARCRDEIAEALAMVEAGQAPTAFDPYAPQTDQVARHWADDPRPLRVALEILEITLRWGDNELEAAYYLWLASRGESYCCRVAPASQRPGNPRSNICCDDCCPPSHFASLNARDELLATELDDHGQPRPPVAAQWRRAGDLRPGDAVYTGVNTTLPDAPVTVLEVGPPIPVSAVAAQVPLRYRAATGRAYRQDRDATEWMRLAD